MTTLRNGKLPLVRFGHGGAYKDELLHGKKLRERSQHSRVAG